jgi:hypothetical protein
MVQGEGEGGVRKGASRQSGHQRHAEHVRYGGVTSVARGERGCPEGGEGGGGEGAQVGMDMGTG